MNKDEKQSIYEIYRACRLCGAGAGYKMPIIQSVIDVDGDDIELKQKIRECVQIEVNNNDRMPPLICELCVDKINDFFEFRTMCQETNKKTRLRLGLPPQAMPRGVQDAEDCILGVTEPVFVNSDSDEGEPLSKHQTTTAVKSRPKPKSAKAKQDSDVKIKIENYQTIFKDRAHSPSPEIIERRETRRSRAPSPKRNTRQNKTDDAPLRELQGLQVQKPSSKPVPKSVLKRERERQELEMERDSDVKTEDLLVLRQKRPREKEVIVETPPPPAKKMKLAPEPEKPGPKSSKGTPKPQPQPQPQPKLPSKAGPKSRKNEPSLIPLSKPGPKSRNSELLPIPSPKLVPKSRNIELLPVPSPKPGPKSRNSELLPVPSPKPGPKSRNSELLPVPSLKPGSKSRNSELLPVPSPKPGPKSKKPEQSPIPAPKPKKPELPPAPAPKSKKTDSSQLSTLKTKKLDPSPPAPRSKKREASPKADRASLLPQKSLSCRICKTKAKSAQGLASHMKSHSPGFTPTKLSCNPCELWFVSNEEASLHHRRHSNKSLPYTCTKCYDDFRTLQDYELHFTRNQCLPTYEVPDVKCEECWKYFPTFKLLEDHKCPGEGGRPGGKCSKCRRTYTLLKHLISHEIRCTVKRKGEPIVDPEISSRMLPMQVRIAKCDSLLKNADQDRCDVSTVSHRFGLDRNCTYPYLYSMGDVCVKREPSINSYDHMVSIKDEIKEEYLNTGDSFIHWDSEVTDESDNDNGTSDLFNTFAKQKRVDTLSTLSLKTIFSPKYLGKVPRRKRKIKSEKAFGSILSIGFHGDIKRNIDNIIDNLANESNNSDNYDSDSILDKNKDQNVISAVSNDFFDSLTTKMTGDIVISSLATEELKEKDDDVKESDKTVNASDIIKKGEDSKDNENFISTDVNQTLNGNETAAADNIQNEQVDNQESVDISEVTNVNNSVEATKLDLPQRSGVASEATDDINEDINATVSVSQNNNDNKFWDDSKNGHVVSQQIVTEKESLSVDDKVESSTLLAEETEKMEVELEQISKLESNEEKVNSAKMSLTIENRDAEMRVLEKEKKDDVQSSDVTNYTATEDPNVEKEYFQSPTTNHLDSNADLEKGIVVPKRDSNDKISDSNDETDASLISFRDSPERSIQSADRFNLNDLNEDEIQLIADLDAQIAENEPKNDVIGENRPPSDVIGPNRPTSDVLDEIRPSSDVIGPNRPTSDVLDEIRPSSDVIGPNSVIGENDSPSVVISANIGFSDDNSNEKNDTLDVFIRKQDADLKSLDLDSISDEEFNFDI